MSASGQAELETERGLPGPRHRGRLAKVKQEQIVLAVAILLALVFAASLPSFRTIGNLVALLRNVSVIGILALGGGIVIIGRGLDISQVGSMVVGAALAAVLMNLGWPLAWCLLSGLGAATAIGLVNGLFIAFIEVPPLFATLAMMLVLAGGVRLVITGGDYQVYLPKTESTFLAFGGDIGGVPIAILVFAGLAILAHLYLSRTRIGRLTYAQGDNPEAARLTGISVRTLTVIQYVLCADIGYVAGLVLLSGLSSINTQMIAGTMIFDVILVAVLGGISLVGGRGSVVSVVVGALLIGVILNGMTLLDFSNDVQNIVRGLVLLGAIVLDNRLHPRDEETARQGE